MKESNKMYVTFELDSGKILGCSVNKSPNSFAIDVALGEKFIMGTESMGNYIVQYNQGTYQLQKNGVLNHVSGTNQNTIQNIVNKDIYRIPDKSDNHKGILIRLLNKQHKIEFIVDETFINTLNLVVSNKNQMMHSFYSCKKHDATQLDQVFEINLYDLAEQKHISMNYNPLYEVDIYCKKVFDYSLERIYE